jgi:hypothetical protein
MKRSGVAKSPLYVLGASGSYPRRALTSSFNNYDELSVTPGRDVGDTEGAN